MIQSVHDWFGNILAAENRIGPDASVFIRRYFPDDCGAVDWLNTHVDGQPVILEANGDSYTGYGRVSVSTGLPTVMGWYTHEWLWRNNTDDQNARAADIRMIYTETDPEEVLRLLRRYDIRYVYIGTLEREKFPDLNEQLLQNLGTVVYSDGAATSVIEIPEDL